MKACIWKEHGWNFCMLNFSSHIRTTIPDGDVENIKNFVDTGRDLTNVTDNSQFCAHQTCISVALRTRQVFTDTHYETSRSPWMKSNLYYYFFHFHRHIICQLYVEEDKVHKRLLWQHLVCLQKMPVTGTRHKSHNLSSDLTVSNCISFCFSKTSQLRLFTSNRNSLTNNHLLWAPSNICCICPKLGVPVIIIHSGSETTHSCLDQNDPSG